MSDLKPRTPEFLLVCLIDDLNGFETPAHDYEPGQHGSVFVASRNAPDLNVQFVHWKHGPLSSVDTMRTIYANTYQARRQLSIRLSDVCHFHMISPSDITYRDIEDYASVVLHSERLCNDRHNWSVPMNERLPVPDRSGTAHPVLFGGVA